MPLDAAQGIRQRVAALPEAALPEAARAVLVLERSATVYRAEHDPDAEGRVTAQIGHIHDDRGTAGDGLAACCQDPAQPTWRYADDATFLVDGKVPPISGGGAASTAAGTGLVRGAAPPP